jgi:sugar phosphate isomerase/epimerase
MRTILDDNGIQYLELEFLTDWFQQGARKGESDSRKQRLFEASAALHASHIKVGDFYNLSVSMPPLVEAFAGLCREAQQFGATIGFEVMGCAMIDNLPEAITLVESAGATNGGLIIDIYQVVHQGWTFDQIRHIPLKYLLNVELNDGTLPGQPDDDPGGRKFCGEGQYDIRGLIQCVQGMGYTGTWAVEVMARNLAGLPLQELSRRAFNSTMAEFEREANW